MKLFKTFWKSNTYVCMYVCMHVIDKKLPNLKYLFIIAINFNEISRASKHMGSNDFLCLLLSMFPSLRKFIIF